MAYKYQKKDGDKQYRQVSVLSENYGPWTEFAGNTVEYPEQCVLEVMHEDGSCSVERERSPYAVNVGRNGDQLFFDKNIPAARMWVRCGSMMYKVPSGLKEKDGKVYVLIPGGVQNVTLCGDEYFSKAYVLEVK